MIDLNWLLVVSATVLPMLVALVTSKVANAGLKATVLAGLSAAAGLLNELYTVGGDTAAYDWNSGLANAVTVFLVGVGLHYGLLKPIGVTGGDGSIANSVPNGLGKTLV